MSDNFSIHPGFEYYVIIRPTIDRDHVVAVTTMGENIRIQGGLVQFGMKDIKIIKEGKERVKEVFHEFFHLPMSTAIIEHTHKLGHDLARPSSVVPCRERNFKFRVNSSGYQHGIFRLEVCRLFIPELCQFDGFAAAVVDAMKHSAEKLDDIFKPYAAELIEQYVTKNKNFMENNNG